MFKGRFDMGYEALRELTLARQKELGIVPHDTELPPVNPIGTQETRGGPGRRAVPGAGHTRPWDTLSADDGRLFCRMAEVYAGFLAHTDAQIGRLLDYLEETGQRENTMVILVSDNGASGEGGPTGRSTRTSASTGCRTTSREPGDVRQPAAEDRQPLRQRVGDGVQHAFKMWKRYELTAARQIPA